MTDEKGLLVYILSGVSVVILLLIVVLSELWKIQEILRGG